MKTKYRIAKPFLVGPIELLLPIEFWDKESITFRLEKWERRWFKWKYIETIEIVGYQAYKNFIENIQNV